MVWMVFYGEPRSDYHAHKVGAAMKVALAPLALGALTSWLAIGGFSKMLGGGSLPFHTLPEFTLTELFHEVVRLQTLIPLAVIAVGLLCWFFREKLAGVSKLFGWLRWLAEHSFGFEAINSGVVLGTQESAEGLRGSQTGILGWNVLGILLTVIILFAIFAIGA
jgi:NADH-quinone oxidoreductase subunit L